MTGRQYRTKLSTLHGGPLPSKISDLEVDEIDDLLLWCQRASGPEAADRSIGRGSSTRLACRGLVGPDDEPDSLWESHGWGRAHALLRASYKDRRKEHPIVSDRNLRPAVSRENFATVRRDLERRSAYAYRPDALTEPQVSRLREVTVMLTEIFPELGIGLLLQGDSARAGAYLVDDGAWVEAGGLPADQLLLETNRGQGWVHGGGAAIFLGADLRDRPPRDYRAVGYLDQLVTVGHAGQQIVLLATEFGLSSRMTPAIDESRAEQAFGHVQNREWLHLVKIGSARIDPVTGEEVA